MVQSRGRLRISQKRDINSGDGAFARHYDVVMRGLMGSGLVSPNTAKHYIAVFSWLINNFSEKLELPNGRLYPLSGEDMISSVPPSESAERAEKWISDHFESLKKFAKMDEWSISFKQKPAIMPKYDKTKMQKHHLFETFSNGNEETYFVDEFGRPIFYYDPHLISKPGYIKTRIIIKLSDMLHKAALKPALIQETTNNDLITLCGTFLGFGHVLCALEPRQKRRPFKQSIESKPAFSLGLYFQVQGMNLQDVENRYSKILSKHDLKNVKFAYDQLQIYGNEISELRNLLNKVEPVNLAS